MEDYKALQYRIDELEKRLANLESKITKVENMSEIAKVKAKMEEYEAYNKCVMEQNFLAKSIEAYLMKGVRKPIIL